MSLVFQHSISSIYLLLSIIFSTRVASINKQVITCLTNFFSSLFSEQHLSSPMTSTQRHHSSVQRLLWLHHTFSGNQSCNTTSFFLGGWSFRWHHAYISETILEVSCFPTTTILTVSCLFSATPTPLGWSSCRSNAYLFYDCFGSNTPLLTIFLAPTCLTRFYLSFPRVFSVFFSVF